MCAAFNGNGQTEAKVYMEGCLEGDGFVGYHRLLENAGGGGSYQQIING